MNKKLIEVALPLDDINAACAREKSIRHGHPSTLHLWWARRPLASARAVTFASLVDDPSSHPEEFPTEADQARERERLFNIIRDLVVWENSNNEDVLARAKAEIMKSTGNNPPAFLDPFAGGGALPLEAQRLGLKTYACDLNPVAVMINKAMINLPVPYLGLPSINPSCNNLINNKGYDGLADDVDYYGKLLLKKVYSKIGYLYPKVHLKNGQDRTVSAWIWARTVECLNPACKCQMPFIHSTDLFKKKGREKHLEIMHNGKVISYRIQDGLSKTIKATVSRSNGIICPVCGQAMEFAYLRKKGKESGFGRQLITIVVEGDKGPLFLSPDECDYREHEIKKELLDRPEGDISFYPGCLNTNEYGFETWGSLYTDRQIVFLNEMINNLDYIDSEVTKDIPIAKKEKYKGYALAIRVYLSFCIDKMAKFHSSFCSWDNTMGKITGMFGRQAISMVWDYAEANPFSTSSGSFINSVLDYEVKALKYLPKTGIEGDVAQWDATQDVGLRNIMISTDPPYYDNIPYAYISDYFYVWMRKALRSTFPDLFSTVLTPKETELTAIRYRFDGGKNEAKIFFENGMERTCKNLFIYSNNDFPVTIYYAFKQTEIDNDDEKASTGWETMLTAIINAGFSITGTWPVRTEITTTLKKDWNSLSSSIVIVCRKTNTKLDSITMRQFLEDLKSETIPALKRLQTANIAPVDLAQSAIGPGIAVYSRYESVIKSDGSKLSVREALKLINHELDSHLNASIGPTDSETSYCMSLYAQKAFNEIGYGDAETLAKAKNVSVADLAGLGVLDSAKGKVSLRVREDIPEFKNNGEESCLWLITQQVVNSYRTKGYEGVAEIFNELSEGTIEKIKSLCYQLFIIADNNGWAQEALAYNEMITTWDSTISVARELKTKKKEVQLELF